MFFIEEGRDFERPPCRPGSDPGLGNPGRILGALGTSQLSDSPFQSKGVGGFLQTKTGVMTELLEENEVGDRWLIKLKWNGVD